MSDRELWDALSVLARRAGWIERGQRIEVVGDPREENVGSPPPWRSCADVALLPGGYRVSCQQQRGHEGDHSEGGTQWGRASEGCNTVGAPSAGAIDWRDTLLTTESPEIQCGARNAAENPVMAGQACNLLRGHVGPHMAVVNGQRVVFGAVDPTPPRVQE